jgi:hypothetical protein
LIAVVEEGAIYRGQAALQYVCRVARSRKEPVMNIIKSLLTLPLLLLPVSGLQAQLLDKKILTLEAAEKVAAAA